ncbi:hypothetical protein FIBSPDRAFT_139038 [Athelia psychrophila]|uniref:Uncharacterized protein n=1 Tax=Athelia psychrophila TaxID=1759441 RepID=A0A166BZU3_9AGAM|nr:hypothetical protein FIBSPDRAFT_139038 [Fibularhizoctonia sp. CBS 109695]
MHRCEVHAEAVLLLALEESKCCRAAFSSARRRHSIGFFPILRIPLLICLTISSFLLYIMPSGPFTKPVSTCLKADLDRLAIHFDLDGSGNIKTLRKRVKDYVDAHADALASDRVFASLFTARDLARLRPVAPPRDITPPTRSTTRSPTPSSDRVPSTWSGIRGSHAPSEHSSRRGFSQIGAGVEDLVDTMGHQSNLGPSGQRRAA